MFKLYHQTVLLSEVEQDTEETIKEKLVVEASTIEIGEVSTASDPEFQPQPEAETSEAFLSTTDYSTVNEPAIINGVGTGEKGQPSNTVSPEAEPELDVHEIFNEIPLAEESTIEIGEKSVASEPEHQPEAEVETSEPFLLTTDYLTVNDFAINKGTDNVETIQPFEAVVAEAEPEIEIDETIKEMSLAEENIIETDGESTASEPDLQLQAEAETSDTDYSTVNDSAMIKVRGIDKISPLFDPIMPESEPGPDADETIKAIALAEEIIIEKDEESAASEPELHPQAEAETSKPFVSTTDYSTVNDSGMIEGTGSSEISLSVKAVMPEAEPRIDVDETVKETPRAEESIIDIDEERADSQPELQPQAEVDTSVPSLSTADYSTIKDSALIKGRGSGEISQPSGAVIPEAEPELYVNETTKEIPLAEENIIEIDGESATSEPKPPPQAEVETSEPFLSTTDYSTLNDSEMIKNRGTGETGHPFDAVMPESELEVDVDETIKEIPVVGESTIEIDDVSTTYEPELQPQGEDETSEPILPTTDYSTPNNSATIKGRIAGELNHPVNAHVPEAEAGLRFDLEDDLGLKKLFISILNNSELFEDQHGLDVLSNEDSKTKILKLAGILHKQLVGHVSRLKVCPPLITTKDSQMTKTSLKEPDKITIDGFHVGNIEIMRNHNEAADLADAMKEGDHKAYTARSRENNDNTKGVEATLNPLQTQSNEFVPTLSPSDILTATSIDNRMGSIGVSEQKQFENLKEDLVTRTSSVLSTTNTEAAFDKTEASSFMSNADITAGSKVTESTNEITNEIKGIKPIGRNMRPLWMLIWKTPSSKKRLRSSEKQKRMFPDNLLPRKITNKYSYIYQRYERNNSASFE